MVSAAGSIIWSDSRPASPPRRYPCPPPGDPRFGVPAVTARICLATKMTPRGMPGPADVTQDSSGRHGLHTIPLEVPRARSHQFSLPPSSGSVSSPPPGRRSTSPRASASGSFLRRLSQASPPRCRSSSDRAGCAAAPTIRYADASLHRLPSVVARAGKASWRWTIPAKVKLGAASATVACGKAGRGVAQLRRQRAAVGAREGDRHQERLLAARALHLARRQLRDRALESLSRERRARRLRPDQLHRLDQSRRRDGHASCRRGRRRAPTTTSAARPRFPMQRRSRSSRS